MSRSGNHPGRESAPAQRRMTPEVLRDLIERAGITQASAAELCGVKLRTMQQYLAGDRTMPLSASGLLCVALFVHGIPESLLVPYMQQDIAAWIIDGE